MEIKLFDKPKYHDAAFYQDREVSDHIHEPGHRERLMEAIEHVGQIANANNILSVSDFGAGNGGLLKCLDQHIKALGGRASVDIARMWGYDMSPKAAQYAREVYGVDVAVLDVAQQFERAKVGDIVVMTEFLEHMVDPHGLLARVRMSEAMWIVASTPGGETPENHYEFHLWIWNGDSFAQMFSRLGFEVVRHYYSAVCGTQFVVARNGG